MINFYFSQWSAVAKSNRILTVHATTIIAALLISSNIAHAHHAFSAEYDAEKPIKITGILTKAEWINPHSFIYLDVKDASGIVTNWKFEFGGPNSLLRRGLRKADFPLGVEVEVSGYLTKSGKSAAYAATAKLPDGRTLFTGSENTGSPEVKLPQTP